MIPYLLAVAGGFLIGASQIKDSFEEGGEIFTKGGGVKSKKIKGDIGISGTQYGYTLKEWEQGAKKNGLLVSPSQWWKNQEGKPYTDSFGRKKKVGQHSGDKQQEMNRYGYLIAIGLDLGSKIIPESAKKYVEENNFSKFENGGTVSDFSEYSNDALYDMIINLSRFENNEELIQYVKDELKRRNEIKKVSIKYKGNDYYFNADFDEGDLEDIDIRPAYKLDHPFFKAIENEFFDYLENLAPRNTQEMYEEEYLIKKEAIREGISAIFDYMIQNNIKELDLDKDWNKIDIEGIWQG
jgi:hypothetical protein